MSVLFGDLHARAGAIRIGLIAAVLALPLAAGCGEDEPEPSSAPAVTGADDSADAENAPGAATADGELSSDPNADKLDIEATLETVLTGTSADQACGDLVTKRYLRRSYGGATGCENAQGDANPAREIRVNSVVVASNSVAQASLRPIGGVYDGERLRAELVLVEDLWKLDLLRSNVPVGP